MYEMVNSESDFNENLVKKSLTFTTKNYEKAKFAD